MPDTDDMVNRVITDLGEHFADLDDQEDAIFGEFARVTAEGDVLTVLHSDEPWGIAITVKRVALDAHACCKRHVPGPIFTTFDGDPQPEFICPECGGRWLWEDDEAEGGGWFWDPENATRLTRIHSTPAIRGVKGEFYPCKPDIFEATYDSVEDGYMSPDERLAAGGTP